MHALDVPGCAPRPIVEYEPAGQGEHAFVVPEPLVEYEPAGHVSDCSLEHAVLAPPLANTVAFSYVKGLHAVHVMSAVALPAAAKYVPLVGQLVDHALQSVSYKQYPLE